MINNGLIKKSGIYFIGNMSSKIMSVLLVPIYAFYISAKDLGTYDISKTLMGIISPIVVLAIWEAVLKFIMIEDRAIEKRKISTTTAIFTLTMCVIFSIAAFFYINFFSPSLEYIGLIVTMIILNTLVQVWQYYARAWEHTKTFVISGVLSTMVNFVFVMIFVVLFKMGLLGLLLAYNIGQISIIVLIESKIRIIRNIKLKDFSFDILKKTLVFSSPLVFNIISAWFISGFGRLLITSNIGTEANGLYSFATNFSQIIGMIGTVVTMAIIEEAIISVKKNEINKNFHKTIESLFFVFQSIALFSIPIIVIFYTFISETNYSSSLFFVPLLLIYAVINTMAANVGSIFQAINKTKYQFYTTMIGGIITFFISIIFIDSIGVYSVIIGQIFGALAMLISRYMLVNKFISLKVKWKPIVFMALIYIMTAIIVLRVNLLLTIIIELLIISVYIYIYRKVIFNICKKRL